MADFGGLPVFRIYFGYPHMAFGLAGLEFTRLSGTYVAYQAEFMGYEGILGFTGIESGGIHFPPLFINLGRRPGRAGKEDDPAHPVSLAGLEPRAVEVYLPIFKVETAYDLGGKEQPRTLRPPSRPTARSST